MGFSLMQSWVHEWLSEIVFMNGKFVKMTYK